MRRGSSTFSGTLHRLQFLTSPYTRARGEGQKEEEELRKRKRRMLSSLLLSTVTPRTNSAKPGRSSSSVTGRKSFDGYE